LTLCSEGTSALASTNALRWSDAKPSAPANLVRETRSFSLTSTAAWTCGPEAVWLAASKRRAKSPIDEVDVSMQVHESIGFLHSRLFY
jgi:hypothetical protein